MHTTKLRKVGGSIMLAVQPSLLEQLDLHVGAIVGVTVSNGHLVVEPMPRPRYKLAELLAASDYSQPQTDDQLEWVVAPTAGREII